MVRGAHRRIEIDRVSGRIRCQEEIKNVGPIFKAVGKDVFAYLDDLVICSRDANCHFTSLEAVLDKLRAAGLKLKFSKCAFLKAKDSFLGHVIDSTGIHTQADKIEGIKNFPQPRTVENVRSFLGLCGYYRPFICGFAKIASPLNQLMKKGVLFHWDAPQKKKKVLLR